jgi:hypothetical protein
MVEHFPTSASITLYLFINVSPFLYLSFLLGVDVVNHSLRDGTHRTTATQIEPRKHS